MKERGKSALTRDKALVVTRNLPPMHGGIERLMQKAVEALASDFECHVIGPQGCRGFLPPSVRVVELPAQLPWFHLLGLIVVAGLRLRHRYALCVAGNGLVAPLAALAAGLSRCPWLVFLHGLDLVARSRIYQALFVPALRGARIVVANSAHTSALARGRGIRGERIRVIRPGVAASTPPRVASGAAGPSLLSVGRLVPRKGFAEFIERSLPLVLQRCADARYRIIGAEPALAAVASGGTRDGILAAVRRAGLDGRVELRGAIPQGELEEAYRAADVLVFPSRGDGSDVEGFGMVILEAAAHGVPTVAFDVGGVGDAMSEDNGVLVPAGDHVAFAQAVVGLADGTLARVTAESCRRHAARYDWSRFTDEVRAAAAAARRAA